MKRIGALVLLAAVAAKAACAAETPAATATLSPDALAAGQVATLQIEVNGSFRLAAAPTLPLTNLTVVAGPSLENRFEWINGKSSSRTELVYRVRADAPGRASIGPVRLVGSDGRVVTTAPISV
ncbi:MAG TPA: BatD family protein, partial [Thermoanaerobaculia bacterium]|nr:BatD family protein [Thermoanaerobaculia bacterium]